jgi:class 3 adenylate cyclase
MGDGESEIGSSKQIAALIFTDIVGSVALQQKLGTNAYTRYVSRHDEIIKECLSAIPDAKILNETGDGFLIRFTDPSDAVNTALRLQYRLSLEKIEGELINIRMGLNMGLITEMDETNRGGTRAVGMPINLVARVMDLGGAGQILMTRVVYDDAKQFVRNHPDSGLSDRILPPPEWVSHGSYEIDGNDENIEIFEIGLEGIAPLKAPEGSKKARPASQATNENSDSSEDAPPEKSEPVDIENSDVLISYAEVDNEPLRSGEDGWISQLQRNLKVRMEQLSGEQVKISRLSGKDFESIGSGGGIIKDMSEAKAVVPVISPPFTNSPGCQKEMEVFYNPETISSQTGSGTPSGSKLFNAIKMPVPSEELPNAISSVISKCPGLEFFEREPSTGRVCEFNEDLGEDSRQRYYERVYDLAYELCEALKNNKDSSTNDQTEITGGRQKIFLAPTTSELTKEYDTVKRELKEHGYHVVPDYPLPLSVNELNKSLEEMITDCVTSIHLMGHNYGLIPEGSSSSIGEILLRFTAEKSSQGLKRFIWSPRDFADGETKQVELLEKIQEDPALHSAAELIEGSITTLKRDIFRVIEEQKKKSEQDANAEIKTVTDSKLIYLICEQRDEEAVEALEDYLFKEGLEVCLPAFDGDEADVKALHQENLINCSGALVYYGAAPRAWVDIKLRDLIKAVGYGRENPIENQAVFIAPPHDHRKERYKSHTAKIIRQNEESFTPDNDLQEFIDTMKGT